MKRLWVILFVLFFVGCSKPIKKESFIDKGGLKYHPETKELYSGEVFSFYMGGNKKSETTYKDGKKDGLDTYWHENGQKFHESTFKNGKQDGLLTMWYDNGQKWEEGTFKDGKQDGLFTEWYENGQKKSEMNFKYGNYDGLLTIWYENGQKWEEGSWKGGKPISSKYWNEDGSAKND